MALSNIRGSKFNLHGTDSIHYIRRTRGEDIEEKCTKKTIDFPRSVTVWGCITGVWVWNRRYSKSSRLHKHLKGRIIALNQKTI